MSISRSFIDELLQRLDIVDVISEQLQLKKQGQSLVCRCPFHEEKTPSFSVDPQRQFYHCFGCGASGDAIQFVRQYQKLEFREAVELLAHRSGLQLPSEEGVYSKKTDPTLYTQLQQASDFYQRQLTASAPANAYLEQRQLNADISRRYALGYAPARWDSLVSRAKNNKELDRLFTTGLIRKREGELKQFYDHFRDRIMFPIRDTRGRIIAFGGRVLSSADRPKYLNSPETSLFHKGRELYGLWELLQSRKAIDSILVVEGYMDLLALAQFGIDKVVATLGTAISKEQLKKMFKHTQKVIFCLDGDKAGQQSANKALETCLPLMIDGREAQFLMLPEGDDPDSYVREHGIKLFTHALEKAQSLSSYLLQIAAEGLDVGSSLEVKAAIAHKALGYIRRLPKGMLQQLILKELAALTGLDFAYLQQGLEQGRLVAPRVRYQQEEEVKESTLNQPQPQQQPAVAEGQNINTDLGLPANRMLLLLVFYPQILPEISVDWDRLRELKNGSLLVLVKEAVGELENPEFHDIKGYLFGKHPELQAAITNMIEAQIEGLGPISSADKALGEFKRLYQRIVDLQLSERIHQELAELNRTKHTQLTTQQRDRYKALCSELAQLKKNVNPRGTHDVQAID